MVGKKLSTLPTPLKIPSIINECRASFTLIAANALSAIPVSHSISISKPSESHAPITLKVSQNTIPIIPINDGIAVNFPVNILSILLLLTCSLFSFGLTTVA